MVRKDYYNYLNEKEKYYFQKIEYYSSEIPAMTINELAEKIHTSPASLSRLVKKLGYINFKEFKISFVRQNIHEYNGPLREHMSKILDFYPKIIDDCLLQHIQVAKKIYIVAFGDSVGTAQELAVTLMKLEYKISRLFDSDFMYEMTSRINHSDLIIYISYSGMDIDMQRFAINFKNTNTQVLITANSNSRLASHVSLIINSHTDSYNLPFKTRLPIELIVAIICMRLYNKEC